MKTIVKYIPDGVHFQMSCVTMGRAKRIIKHYQKRLTRKGIAFERADNERALILETDKQLLFYSIRFKKFRRMVDY